MIKMIMNYYLNFHFIFKMLMVKSINLNELYLDEISTQSYYHFHFRSYFILNYLN